MRFLIVQDTDWLKRNPAQQHHLADRLSIRGHELRVIDYEILWRTQRKGGFLSRRQIFDSVSKTIEGANITVIRPGIIKVPWLDYISLIFSFKAEIERQLKEFAPDVIWGLGILGPYLAMKAARRNRCPFIYYKLDASHRLVPFKLFQPIARAIEKKTLRQSDRVLVINEKLRELMIKMGADPARSYVQRAGIDPERFKLGVNRDKIRGKYKFEPKDIVLFFMGWLYNFSGLKEVALHLAKIKNSNLKLLIVGDGDAYAELQKIREKYNLQDRLILVGKQPYREIPSFIAAVDICLLPAYDNKIMQDIVPIKMYEYMIMGKPVIATMLPGVMKEFGENNGVVYVTKPEDVIGKAVEMVTAGNLGRLGSEARKFAERYSWDNITDEFEGIVEEAVKATRDSDAAS